MSVDVRPGVEPPVREPRSAWNRVDWGYVAQAVSDAAPEWCEIGEFSPGLPTKVRQGAYAEIDPDLFEVKASEAKRDDGRRRVILYMRSRRLDAQ